MEPLEESKLSFAFEGKAVQFDRTAFYRNHFSVNQSEGKGVDFIALSRHRIQLIEVKNCKGYEVDNRWRIGRDNRSREKLAPGQNESDRDSLDIETAKKVGSTLACLYGAWTKKQQTDYAVELAEIWERMIGPQIPACENRITVILFLEGDFGSKTIPKSKLMKGLERSIKKKLSWLNCDVSVTDLEWYQKYTTGFEVKEISDEATVKRRT